MNRGLTRRSGLGLGSWPLDQNGSMITRMKGEELDAALRSAEAADDFVRMVNVLKHAAEHGIWDAAATWRRAAKLLYDELGDLHGARDAWKKVLEHAPSDVEANAQLKALDKELA